MARVTNQQLQELVAQLQQENATLKADLATRPEPSAPPTATAEPPAKRKRGWGWTVLATALIVIGALLAPVAVVSNWAKNELTDTDTFVATFAPLAKDKAVQKLVTDEVVTAVDKQVNLDELTKNVFDSVAKLGLPPTASTALKALSGPAADGIRNLIRSTVSGFVASDAFQNIWQQTLRTTHEQLIATMQGDKNAAVTIGAGGEIGVQLGPIIAQVKSLLVKQGIPFAESIPKIDKTIVIATSNYATLAQGAYGLIVALGSWLVWVVLAFLVLGVAVARRRPLALVWAAVALSASALLTLAALGIGRVVFIANVSPAYLPVDAADRIYTYVITYLQSIAIAVTVLAITVAIVAWLGGPFRIPRRLRGLVGSGFAALRRTGERYQLTTGAVGVWMYRQRVLLRVAVAVIAAAVVLFVRPLTPPLIIWTAVIAVLVVAALELVERPPAAVIEVQEDGTVVVDEPDDGTSPTLEIPVDADGTPTEDLSIRR